MTQSLIEKIEAAIRKEYADSFDRKDFVNTGEYRGGLEHAENIILAIILEHQKDKLELVEITEEEAKKEDEVVGRWDCIGISEMYVPTYQVVTYDPDAEGWGVEWVDCLMRKQVFMYVTPSKFYRLPQAKEEE